MIRLLVVHRTTYRYAVPVSFGPHRMMLRPRDSHDMRVLSATLVTQPNSELLFTYDVFGNVVCHARFAHEADGLTIESRLEIERYPMGEDRLFATGADLALPIAYTADERIDLGALAQVDDATLGPDLLAWIDGMAANGDGRVVPLLTRLCREIRESFRYELRFEEDTRAPAETFALRSGACRDYAALFIACVRHLGFGARFVSGYLFDPPAAGSSMQGAGFTHAWAEVYLPSVGWVEFDPTNGLVASERLIRVAAVRDPGQASPISGSYLGPPGVQRGLFVDVSVTPLDAWSPALQAA